MKATSATIGGGVSSKSTSPPTSSQPTSCSPPATSLSSPPSKLSNPSALGRGPSSTVNTTVSTSRLGFRGGLTGMGPSWKGGASSAIPLAAAGVVGAGPRPVPRDEAVVLRRFPSDDPTKGNEPDKRQRTGSDSDAMALLRLASTASSSNNSPPSVSKDGKENSGGAPTENRGQEQQPPPPGGGGGEQKESTSNGGGEDGNGNNHKLRPLQQQLQKRSVVVDYAVGLALRRHVLLPLLKDIQDLNEQKRRLSELQVARLLGKYARGELVLMERPLEESDKRDGTSNGEKNGDKVAAAPLDNGAEMKSDETCTSKKTVKEEENEKKDTNDKDREKTVKVKKEKTLNGEEKKEEKNPTEENSDTSSKEHSQEKEETSPILSASIQLVDKDDAKTLASWYDNHGDKVLPNTSAEWSDWWKYRCGNPDPGCEMAKLVMNEDFHVDNGKAEDEKKKNGSGDKQKKENVLGVVYYERNVLDRYPSSFKTKPITSEDCGAPKCNNTVTDNKEKKVQDKDSNDNDKEGKEEQHNIYTTLLRGIRISPHINREVARRSSLSKSTEKVSNMAQYSDIVTKTLLQFVLFRALLCGAKCLGVTSAKSETAEEFYDDVFGLPLCIRDDDGRRFYRMEGDERWRVLRDGVKDQAKLWIKWDVTQDDDEVKEDAATAAKGEKDKTNNDKKDKSNDNEVMEDTATASAEKGETDEVNDENKTSSQFESAVQDMEIDKKDEAKDDKKRALDTSSEDKTDDSPSPAAKKSRVEKNNKDPDKDDSKDSSVSTPTTEESSSSTGNDKVKVEMEV